MSDGGKGSEGFQAIVAAPDFCVGVRCDEREVLAISYLEPRAERVLRHLLHGGGRALGR